jgi:hypothetical protein
MAEAAPFGGESLAFSGERPLTAPAAAVQVGLPAGTAMSRAIPPHPYSVHPSVAMVRGWIDALSQKTGRSLDDCSA